MTPTNADSTITLSSQDHFILTNEGPGKGDLSSGNIDNAVSDNHWVDNLYAESSGHFQEYMSSIAKIRVLKKKEEVELVERIKLGDEKALEKMIHHNLRLVVWAAMKYRRRLYGSHGMELMDLVQEGNLGLIMKAVKKFDLSYDCKFSTYALWWIKQMISRSLDEQSRTMRLPVHICDDLRKYDKAVQKLTVMNLREPSVDEIVEESRLEPEKVWGLQRILLQTSMVRIKSHNDDDGNAARTPYYQVPCQSKSAHRILHEKEVRRQLSLILKINLNIKEYEIFIMRHGLDGNKPMTREEIGKEYHVTRERIRQIEAKAFEKLKLSLPLMKLARGCGIKIDRELYEAAKEKVALKLIFNFGEPKDAEIPDSSLQAVIKTVSAFYNVHETLVRNGNREAKLVKPRHISMYLLRKDLNISFPKIAKTFNDMDHTSILHACQKIHDALRIDPGLVAEVDQIRKILQPESQVSPSPSTTPVSPLSVIKKVADFYHIKEALIYNGIEAAEVVKVRQVITYVFKDLLKLPLEDIGRKLGGRAVETVANWYDKIEGLVRSDSNTASEIEDIKTSLCHP